MALNQSNIAKEAALHMESILKRVHAFPAPEKVSINTPSYKVEGLLRQQGHNAVEKAVHTSSEVLCTHINDALRYIFLEDMKTMNKQLPCRNWEFTIPHRDTVCPEEVTKHINRNNPVGFIKYSDLLVCFVHSSIMHKAHILRDVPWNFKESSINGIYMTTSNNIKMQDVIMWARYIKKAPWGNIKRKETVRVIIPKI
jgi:hypothetical protein